MMHDICRVSLSKNNDDIDMKKFASSYLSEIIIIITVEIVGVMKDLMINVNFK